MINDFVAMEPDINAEEEQQCEDVGNSSEKLGIRPKATTGRVAN
jgi:hypothetical protein